MNIISKNKLFAPRNKQVNLINNSLHKKPFNLIGNIGKDRFDYTGNRGQTNNTEKISKSERSQKSSIAEYLEICREQGITPRNLEYVNFILNSNVMKDKYFSPVDSYWSYPSMKRNHEYCAWKMHLYSDNTKDFMKMASAVLPYLQNQGVYHKCLSQWKTPEDLADGGDGKQKGKAITIYPKNIAQMEKVAKDLDSIIKNNRLQIHNSNINGDRQMGNSGRLFYRYELDSGKYALTGIDDSSYNNHYQANRSNMGLFYPYLAADMKLEDDIWRNFNPADPDSHPSIIEKSYKLYNGQKTVINPKNTEISMTGNENGDIYRLNLNSDKIRDRLSGMQDDEILTIGREDCDIQVPANYTYISRHHGYIQKTNGVYVYTDTSTNGTNIKNITAF